MPFKTQQTSCAETKLEREIHDLMQSLDALKASTSHDTRQSYDQLRERAADILQRSRSQWGETCSGLSHQACRTGQCVSDCARSHPWATIALGVAAAALIGLACSCRHRN